MKRKIKKKRKQFQRLKLGGRGIGSGLWGDGQLFSLFTTCTAEHWWDLCPNITDICYESGVRPPTNLKSCMNEWMKGKLHFLQPGCRLQLHVAVGILWYRLDTHWHCLKSIQRISNEWQDKHVWIMLHFGFMMLDSQNWIILQNTCWILFFNKTNSVGNA